MANSTDKAETARIIQLAERADEILEITELEPEPRKSGVPIFIGKSIDHDRSITSYPKRVVWWRQSVARIPATPTALFAYLRGARTRNICLLRGKPANVERQPTKRQYAFEYNGENRGDHGFIDEPTKLFFFDADGIKMKWRDDPEGAIRELLTRLGEPWCSTTCVWFFSATHGLERDATGDRWTGKISDNSLRVHLGFITERALNWQEAVAFTNIAKAQAPDLKLDDAISRVVQPHYIKRPLWLECPDRDPLGDIPTIGRIKGKRDYLMVPDDLTHKARWAAAQGHQSEIADHPDAETAVRAIGSDGDIRPHIKSAVQHLLIANPAPEVVSFDDHAANIIAKLRSMIEQYRDEIASNLRDNKRAVDGILRHVNSSWAIWLLHHPAALNRKTIKLIKEETKTGEGTTLEALCERVARAIERARKGEPPIEFNHFEAYGYEGIPMVELVAAPTGSLKSTLMRAAAVRYVTEHPDRSVLILMPRHNLGQEQIEQLSKEHPNYDQGAAIWRGRLADDPETPDPQHPGKFKKMCLRDKEAEEIEKAKLSVESNLCKQGRGKKVIKCPLYDVCGYQRQKQIEASIRFAAHEVAVHEMPKVFGNVGWVIFDESPLDAFITDVIELPLDKLRDELPAKLRTERGFGLRYERDDLYKILDQLRVPIDRHKGVPVTKSHLKDFADTAHDNAGLELWGKIEPDISPTMTARQVKRALKSAKDNDAVFMRKMLWELVDAASNGEAERCGRIQVHRGEHGRVIRMIGLRPLAKGWNVQTLICDATGDRELLKAIWPDLQIEAKPWPQLPRPASVRIFQIVDRSISKYAIAVESRIKDEPRQKDARAKDLERKGESARRMYAALLLKAMTYGGADVAAIIYKSTRAWIEENCFVPDWLKLAHHGDVTGSNIFENVRAIFEIGRMQPPPEAMVRQAEALFGAFIPQREYVKGKGRIPIVPDEAGNTVIEVTQQYQHRNPVVQRLLWQAREGGSIQNAGRARAGRRTAETPLDIHRWTDVPVPELGPVEPVLWGEVDAGLDGLMLATGGVWLECIPDAATAYHGLITVTGLKSARTRGEYVSLIIDLLLAEHTDLLEFRYQLPGRGRRLAKALSLRDLAATRAWLEEKLGPLARFEVGELSEGVGASRR